MTHENDDDFYKLTFSQREGKAPLPEPMRLEHVPRKFRQEVWLSIETEISETSGGFEFLSWIKADENIGSIIYSYKFDISGDFHDDIEYYGPKESAEFFKKWIRNGNYHEVLTLIEFILRHEYCSENLRQGLVDDFDSAPIAYFVDDKNRRSTIMPRCSREAGEATQQAIETIRESGMDGAATHLRQAAEHMNAQQYADSITDSIGAVESVARRIAPKSNTLGDALKALEKKGLLSNKQLKAGFEKIYAFTNSTEGVRHAQVFKDSLDVGLDEAVFMFGACASFAAYLVNKHREVEKEGSDGE